MFRTAVGAALSCLLLSCLAAAQPPAARLLPPTDYAAPPQSRPTAPAPAQPPGAPADPDTLPIDLPTALRLADSSNPTIQVAEARVRQAYYRLKQAQVWWLPSLRANTTYNR